MSDQTVTIPAAPATPPPAQPQAAPTQPAASPQQPAQFSLDKFEQEFSSAGKLSDASYQELASKGYDRSTVDRYVEGRRAHVELAAMQRQSAVFGAAGGQEKFSQAVEWAKASLNDGQKTAFNAAVQGNDIEAAKLAVQGLLSQYHAAHGIDPKLVGGSGSPTAVAPFSSRDEVMKAMQDPKYKTDSAFRETVYRRLESSQGRFQ